MAYSPSDRSETMSATDSNISTASDTGGQSPSRSNENVMSSDDGYESDVPWPVIFSTSRHLEGDDAAYQHQHGLPRVPDKTRADSRPPEQTPLPSKPDLTTATEINTSPCSHESPANPSTQLTSETLDEHRSSHQEAREDHVFSFEGFSWTSRTSTSMAASGGTSSSSISAGTHTGTSTDRDRSAHQGYETTDRASFIDSLDPFNSSSLGGLTAPAHYASGALVPSRLRMVSSLRAPVPISPARPAAVLDMATPEPQAFNHHHKTPSPCPTEDPSLAASVSTPLLRHGEKRRRGYREEQEQELLKRARHDVEEEIGEVHFLRGAAFENTGDDGVEHTEVTIQYSISVPTTSIEPSGRFGGIKWLRAGSEAVND